MKFLFFGDSICVGQRVSPYLTWASRIGMSLCERRENLTVINNSVNGNTTRMALERVQSDLQAENAQVVYIQFGLNDANYWVTDNGHPRVSLMAYEANLHEIIERARLAGAKKIFLANNHPTQEAGPIEDKISSKAPRSYRDNIFLHNARCAEVASQAEVDFLDIHAAWLSGPEADGNGSSYLDPDGLHLSLKGHDFYYDLLFPSLRRKVADL
jgi:lysophospholipase L1-like esterase